MKQLIGQHDISELREDMQAARDRLDDAVERDARRIVAKKLGRRYARPYVIRSLIDILKLVPREKETVTLDDACKNLFEDFGEVRVPSPFIINNLPVSF